MASEGKVVPCGWGRLIFAHTFPETRDVATELLAEKPGERDIAFYVVEPHLILNAAPRDLFMDPSDTYRLAFSDYAEAEAPAASLVFDEPAAGDIDQINRIYLAQGMVPIDPDAHAEIGRGGPQRYFVARDGSGHISGVCLGVDHAEAFQDIENGSSLWSLAVDPQSPVPGVGEALVRHLVEYYRARGRSQLDLSVMHDNGSAIRLYEKLGFQRVPVFAIKRCNPINEKLYTGGAVPGGFNPYAKILIDEAARRGISIDPVLPAKGLFRLSLGGRSILCRESLSELTSAPAMTICDDKEMTREVLEAAGLRLPRQTHATGGEEDAAFLAACGRVVVKPARGEQGHGVAVNLSAPAEVAAAVEEARKWCEVVLIEEFIEGEDLRVVVINFEVVAAALRRPPEIVGTGTHTVGELIARASRRRESATGGESRIPMDAETNRCLEAQGMDLESVPEAGVTVRVRSAANLHTGGTIHDVTANLHPELAEASVAAAHAIGIPVVGLDLIVEAPDSPRYAIIEANERPGLANHEPCPTAERFIDLLFPQTAKPTATLRS
jgi:GNAT-family acetyltransferase (TIGR03103 family)